MFRKLWTNNWWLEWLNAIYYEKSLGSGRFRKIQGIWIHSLQIGSYVTVTSLLKKCTEFPDSFLPCINWKYSWSRFDSTSLSSSIGEPSSLWATQSISAYVPTSGNNIRWASLLPRKLLDSIYRELNSTSPSETLNWCRIPKKICQKIRNNEQNHLFICFNWLVDYSNKNILFVVDEIIFISHFRKEVFKEFLWKSF